MFLVFANNNVKKIFNNVPMFNNLLSVVNSTVTKPITMHQNYTLRSITSEPFAAILQHSHERKL
jgi:hypothetical protein